MGKSNRIGGEARVITESGFDCAQARGRDSPYWLGASVAVHWKKELETNVKQGKGKGSPSTDGIIDDSRASEDWSMYKKPSHSAFKTTTGKR